MGEARFSLIAWSSRAPASPERSVTADIQRVRAPRTTTVSCRCSAWRGHGWQWATLDVGMAAVGASRDPALNKGCAEGGHGCTAGGRAGTLSA